MTKWFNSQVEVVCRFWQVERDGIVSWIIFHLDNYYAQKYKHNSFQTEEQNWKHFEVKDLLLSMVCNIPEICWCIF